MLDQVDDTTADVPTGAAQTSIAPQARLKGIAICGSNPHTKHLAPFSDPGFLIYACSPDNSPFGARGSIGKDGKPLCSPLPRVDEFFEIHNPIFDRSRRYAYLEWIAKTQKRLWMRDQVAMNLCTREGNLLFPNAALYPERAVKDRFGPFTWTSSISLIMGKAILDIEAMVAKGIMGGDGPPEMPLYGILQMGKDEYSKQRQGTQNMIWAATKAGIKVKVAAESGLLEPPPEDF
jgi:hypothetical protein